VADFNIKRGDRLPSIRATLAAGGEVVNLAGATVVKFILAPKGGGPVKVKANAVVVNAAQGLVRYDWAAADTDTAGQFQGEWEVTWADGKPQTFPTASYHSIDILADLDGA
jgi:hypothetical protein